MELGVLVPIGLGVAAVVQTGINRSIGRSWSWEAAVGLNGLVVLAIALVAWIVLQLLQPAGHGPLLSGTISWWYIIPGLCGFALVSGLPFAMARIGAVKVFIIVVASQIIASFAWDVLVDHRSVSPIRVIGSAVTIAGAVMVTWLG